MKKRIFIAMHYLEIGGAETSLIGLLHSFDYSKYEVDLFLYAHRGELLRYIPKEVHLLPEEKKYAQLEIPIVEVLKQGSLDIALARLWGKYKYARYAKRNRVTEGSGIFQYVQDAVMPFLPSLKKYGTYDLAISFLTPHRIVLDKVSAKKKIAWIHTDYSTIQVNVEKELPVWSQYDYIASISEEVTKTFLKPFPSLKDKIVIIENILSKDLILQRADEEEISFSKENGRINFLSIGRFSYAKNFDNIPDICRRIRESDYNVYWYIIGYGGDEALIRQKIAEAGMQEYVLLLGKQENPYPYILACDFYMQPSRFEGKSVTVREAQLLCKPVVITNYPTAKSQVTHGKDGFIVPLDNKLCANGIAEVLNNSKAVDSCIQNLRVNDFSNRREIMKIERLV
jgi:glycosyltransferase involved in cell wall biosynthesis